MSRAQAFFDVLGSMARRVKPSNEEDIVRAILAQRSAIESSPLGFTMDPRTGRMLNVGNDLGYSMATVPEDPVLNRALLGSPATDLATRAPMNAIDEVALESLIREPYFMDELRRGANFGGWFDEDTNQFVLDAPRRFTSKDRSIIRGDRAKQKAGYDLGAGAQYNLDDDVVAKAIRQEALRQLRRAAGAGVVGTAGFLEMRD